MFGDGVMAMDRLTKEVLLLAQRHQRKYGLTDEAVRAALSRARFAETADTSKPAVAQCSAQNWGTTTTERAFVKRPVPQQVDK